MDILKKTSVLLLPLFLTACYSEFDPKIDTTPVLCLNSLIKEGQPIKPDVSRTWIYTDRNGQRDHSVKDAQLKITANGQPVDTTYLAKEGDHIRIEASSNTYGYAEAEVDVPYATPIDQLDYDLSVRSIWLENDPKGGITGNLHFDINADIDIRATPDRKGRYMLSFIPYQGAPQNFYNGNFISYDPIFSEYVSDFDEIMGYSQIDNAFFSDANFKAASRKIHFRFEGCSFYFSRWKPESDEIMQCGYRLTLNTISTSYFDWAMYYWNGDLGIIGDFSDMGLAEPIWGYSNVSTGAGVVAAQSSMTVLIDLRDLLRKAIDDYTKTQTHTIPYPRSAASAHHPNGTLHSRATGP